MDDSVSCARVGNGYVDKLSKWLLLARNSGKQRADDVCICSRCRPGSTFDLRPGGYMEWLGRICRIPVSTSC